MLEIAYMSDSFMRTLEDLCHIRSHVEASKQPVSMIVCTCK